MRALDLPTPRICQIERTANLAGTAVCDVPEPPWIAAMAAPSFSKVEHDAARSALDLIGSLWAVLPELRDHGPQGTNQIERDVIGEEHGFSWVFSSGRERPLPTTSAAGLRPSRPIRATTRDERPHRRTWSSQRTSSRRRSEPPGRAGVRREGVRGRA
ncbi:MAG TPA: hypothetical protein VF516_09995, partial [Kofleriaceae bacterium]